MFRLSEQELTALRDFIATAQRTPSGLPYELHAQEAPNTARQLIGVTSMLCVIGGVLCADEPGQDGGRVMIGRPIIAQMGLKPDMRPEAQREDGQLRDAVAAGLMKRAGQAHILTQMLAPGTVFFSFVGTICHYSVVGDMPQVFRTGVRVSLAKEGHGCVVCSSGVKTEFMPVSEIVPYLPMYDDEGNAEGYWDEQRATLMSRAIATLN